MAAVFPEVHPQLEGHSILPAEESAAPAEAELSLLQDHREGRQEALLLEVQADRGRLRLFREAGAQYSHIEEIHLPEVLQLLLGVQYTPDRATTAGQQEAHTTATHITTEVHPIEARLLQASLSTGDLHSTTLHQAMEEAHPPCLQEAVQCRLHHLEEAGQATLEAVPLQAEEDRRQYAADKP